MATYKARGVILERRNFFEADRMITVLTKYRGKLKVLAKGVRKTLSKNAGAIELFVVSDLILAEGRNLDILASAEIVKSFKGIRCDLKKTAIACQIGELTNKILQENQEHIDIYNLIKRTFSYLDRAQIPKDDLIFEYYAFRSLSSVGFKPQLNVCVDCGAKLKKEKNFFSSKDGGILCQTCASSSFAPPSGASADDNPPNRGKIPSALADGVSSDKIVLGVEPNQIKILRLFLERDISYFAKIKITEKDAKALKKIVGYYLKYIIEKELKSGKFTEIINRVGQGE